MGKLSKFKRKQTDKERTDAATGNISAVTTKAGNKPLSMSAYRSLTIKQRADAIVKADKKLREGEITEAQHKAIVDKIEQAEELERLQKRLKSSGARTSKDVSLKEEMPPLKSQASEPSKETPLTYRDKEKLQEILKKQEAQAKPKPMKRGGVMKTGHMDYRKGGMFYK